MCSYKPEDQFEEDQVVYVEPGRGYGQVLAYLRKDDLWAVTMLKEDNVIIHKEADNIFPVHNEFYYNQLESLTERLMSYAGNYELPSQEAQDAIFESMKEVCDMYRLAKANGVR